MMRWLILGALFYISVSAAGQDALPTKETSPTPTADPNSVRANPTPTPIPTGQLEVIPAPLPSPGGGGGPPATAPELPDLSQLEEVFKKATPGKEVEEYRAHVAWRELKNRTGNDPEVVAAKAAAEAATTDLEKRNRLRAFYEVYYRRMITLASTPQMADYLKKAQDAHLRLLAQPRVRPTPGAAKKPGE